MNQIPPYNKHTIKEADCTYHKNGLNPSSNEKLKFSHIYDNVDTSAESEIIAIQFFHFLWVDIYYILSKQGNEYQWSKKYSEHPLKFTMGGVEYSVFRHDIPNYIKKRTGIDSFAIINKNYSDIPLINERNVYYSKEELPIFGKILSEKDIRNANIYKANK